MKERREEKWYGKKGKEEMWRRGERKKKGEGMKRGNSMEGEKDIREVEKKKRERGEGMKKM